MVKRMTFAGQHPAQAPIPEAAALPGQLAQSLAQRRVVRPLALVAQRRTIQVDQAAGVSLTQPVAPADLLGL